MMSSIEELKNGHIVSHMYGRYSQLLMDPPHVVIFSNQKCPQHTLTKDRWKTFRITKNFELKSYEDNHSNLNYPK